jgi:hypothetical protein
MEYSFQGFYLNQNILILSQMSNQNGFLFMLYLERIAQFEERSIDDKEARFAYAFQISCFLV